MLDIHFHVCVCKCSELASLIKFIPGQDDEHFCKPTSVAVSSDGRYFFVADGYCNSRIIKYEVRLLSLTLNGDVTVQQVIQSPPRSKNKKMESLLNTHFKSVSLIRLSLHFQKGS